MKKARLYDVSNKNLSKFDSLSTVLVKMGNGCSCKIPYLSCPEGNCSYSTSPPSLDFFSCCSSLAELCFLSGYS